MRTRLVIGPQVDRVKTEVLATPILHSCWQQPWSLTPALPFCHVSLTASRPLSPAYPRELNTLADHLRRRRLDLGLLQREVAQRLEVDKDYVYYWEKNRYSPSLHFIPRIIRFLGYMPYDTSAMTLGERIVTLRRYLGLRREELAERLAVDKTTLRDWEHGKRRPLKANWEKLEVLLTSLRHSLSAADDSTLRVSYWARTIPSGE